MANAKDRADDCCPAAMCTGVVYRGEMDSNMRFTGE